MRKLVLASFTLGVLSATVPAVAEEEVTEGDDPKADEVAAQDEEEGPKEEDPSHANGSVMIEPVLAIIGFLEGEIDVSVTDSVAASIWAQYFDYSLGDTGFSGFGAGVGAPIFFTGEVSRGAYVYPLFKFQKVRFSVADEEANVTYYGPQVTAGYQWTWGRPVGFSLRLGGGLEYSFGKLDNSVFDEDVSFEGFDYELDTVIGLTF